MTTDFRALCAELLTWAERTSAHYVAPPHVIIRARAALSAPEQGPKDDAELRTVYAIGSEARWREGFPEEWSLTDMERAAQTAGLLAVLNRWGRPAVEPVPVSERLPGPEDTTDRNECWYWHPGEECWEMVPVVTCTLDEWTHWLPYWALPVPQEGADGQH